MICILCGSANWVEVTLPLSLLLSIHWNIRSSDSKTHSCMHNRLYQKPALYFFGCHRFVARISTVFVHAAQSRECLCLDGIASITTCDHQVLGWFSYPLWTCVPLSPGSGVVNRDTMRCTGFHVHGRVASAGVCLGLKNWKLSLLCDHRRKETFYFLPRYETISHFRLQHAWFELQQS